MDESASKGNGSTLMLPVARAAAIKFADERNDVSVVSVSLLGLVKQGQHTHSIRNWLLS